MYEELIELRALKVAQEKVRQREEKIEQTYYFHIQKYCT